jgi:mRNA interferase MazF
MADKVTTVPKARLGQRVGRLSNHDMLRLSRAIIVFLVLAG